MSTVDVLIYDLSRGLAKAFSPIFLGAPIEAIYHSSIVVYGHEIYFGGNGTNGLPLGGSSDGSQSPSSETNLSNYENLSSLPENSDGIYVLPDGVFPTRDGLNPIRRITLGVTHLSEKDIISFLTKTQQCKHHDLGPFRSHNYELFDCNCNHFADIFAKTLLDGVGIPSEVVDLPKKILSLPQGRALKSIIEGWLGNATSKNNNQRPKLSMETIAGGLMQGLADHVSAAQNSTPKKKTMTPTRSEMAAQAQAEAEAQAQSQTKPQAYDPKVAFNSQPQNIQNEMSQALLNFAMAMSQQLNQKQTQGQN